MTKREAEERRLEQRARKIGPITGCWGVSGDYRVWFTTGPFFGRGPTRLAALRDLLRRCDRLADRVIASREGE